MLHPVLIRQDGQARFVTRYHQRGAGQGPRQDPRQDVVSAGERYEFDVTPAVRKIETDTRLGLTDALVDIAWRDGLPNVAQWLQTKQGVAGGGLHPYAKPDNQTRRQGRLPTIQPKLEQRNNGWVLALAHADGDDRYGPKTPTHVVTQEITQLRQDVVDDQIKKWGNIAWSERRPDVMTWLNDLSVQFGDNANHPYGVDFAVAHKTDGRLDIPEPKLRPTPSFAR